MAENKGKGKALAEQVTEDTAMDEDEDDDESDEEEEVCFYCHFTPRHLKQC